MIFLDFDPALFARGELSADPYAPRRELGEQIARAAARPVVEADCFWTPPADHDASPEAVAARLAAGEESERRYEARREAARELKDDEPADDAGEE